MTTFAVAPQDSCVAAFPDFTATSNIAVATITPDAGISITATGLVLVETRLHTNTQDGFAIIGGRGAIEVWKHHRQGLPENYWPGAVEVHSWSQLRGTGHNPSCPLLEDRPCFTKVFPLAPYELRNLGAWGAGMGAAMERLYSIYLPN